MDIRPCSVPQGPWALRLLRFGRARGPDRTAFCCVSPNGYQLSVISFQKGDLWQVA